MSHADLDHDARALAVHEAADERAQHRRDEEAEGEGAGGKPRSQPNSSRIGGNSSEKAVRALTPIAMVTKATPTMIQP